MSRSVRFKLRGEEAQLALDICAQLQVPLDLLGYQLYKVGLGRLLEGVLSRQEIEAVTRGQIADGAEPINDTSTEVGGDLVHAEGDSGDTSQEPGSTGTTTEVPMEPASYSVENV